MTKPKPCKYDRELGYRIIKRTHLDPLPDGHPADCPGCVPCEETHCSVCGRRHLDDVHPQTCDECVGAVREDLAEIRASYRLLRGQAIYASDDGRPWAAAPIPGAVATVLAGPAVRAQDIIVAGALSLSEYDKIHLKHDPVPPLAVLADWEDRWAAWLGHDRGRTTVTRSVGYLDGQLTYMAQQRIRLDAAGQAEYAPDFGEFSHAVAKLRAQLERVLHDEETGEEGVDCFECGHQLVRRIRDPKRCGCPPRPVLQHADHGPCTCSFRVRVEPAEDEHKTPLVVKIYDDPKHDRHVHARPDLACIACHREAEWAARHARHDQGGLKDPSPACSWECTSCRMSYSPGEYSTAVRRDLLDRDDGTGWTTFPLAADTAADITGRPITVTSIRKWVERGDEIAVCCEWTRGRRFGHQLVFWPDVAVRASETRRRGRRTSSVA